MQDKIAIQRKKIQAGNPIINLTDSCRIENGIKVFNNEEKDELAAHFDNQKEHLDICFFVPASGSGSRMFKALYEFLHDPDHEEGKKAAKLLIDRIEDFAFYHHLTDEWKTKIREDSFSSADLIRYLITDYGLNLGEQPKGLIPFHIYDNDITNPFHEHLLQGTQIGDSNSTFHFTINRRFEEKIKSKIESLARKKDLNYDCEFSEQDPSTNSIAFDDKLEPATDSEGNIITRPAGHGALIKNLNSIDADVIFIRNIDNMQHASKAGTSIQSRKFLAGALLKFQSAVFEILKTVDNEGDFESLIKAFNEKYDMRIPENLYDDATFAKRYFNRPLRVCGMVKNEGEPGGGPFWVKDNGNQLRQIIEKSQISDDPEQIKLMETATHFNPVELVCAVRNYKGEKYALSEFVNQDEYFIVHKSQAGKAIQYIEQPGLWNGAMSHWLTQFIEIESVCFSPVKTVMDLLKPPHQSN